MKTRKFAPIIQMSTNDTSLVIKVDAPGVEKSGITITTVASASGSTRLDIGWRRTLVGDGSSEELIVNENIYLSKTLDVNKINATLNLGVLELVIPKHPRDEPKKIQIN